ncbi:MAG: HAD family hydrolase, partial [Chitinispirillaceae bacterium]|nr:HAD family hydrolase [Chitinispirillaceae bacterium]
YANVTDVGIIAEILERNGIVPERRIIAAVRERFRVLLKGFFDRGGTCKPVPGAPEFLHLLVKTPLFSVGIATGGWGATALMKCASAGIAIEAVPLSSSDDADNRTAIMLHCLAKMGGPFPRIVYFGDGTWDRDACERLGWTFVGIGEKLKGDCGTWFEDFRDGESMAAAIGGFA